MEAIVKLWMPVTKTKSGELVGILSDTSIDRDGEFMTKELLQDWAKTNKKLKALANHENKMEKWVGGWNNLRVVQRGDHSALIGTPWFFSADANPLAGQISRQVEEAISNGENPGISIGAIPLETIEKEINGKRHRGYKRAELLEGTWVPLQSNRNASFGHIAKSLDLSEEDLHATCESSLKSLDTEETTMENIEKQEVVDLTPKVEELTKSNDELTAKVAELEKQLAEKELAAQEVQKGKESVEAELKELKEKAVLKAVHEPATVPQRQVEATLKGLLSAHFNK